VAGGRTQTRGRLRRCERSASAAAPRWHRVDRGSPCVPAPREHRKRVLRWPQHQRRAVLAAVADRNAMWVRREGVPEAVRPCSHQFRRCSRTYAPLRPHPNSFLASSPGRHLSSSVAGGQAYSLSPTDNPPGRTCPVLASRVPDAIRSRGFHQDAGRGDCGVGVNARGVEPGPAALTLDTATGQIRCWAVRLIAAGHLESTSAGRGRVHVEGS
jgi:hypothetical protein